MSPAAGARGRAWLARLALGALGALGAGVLAPAPARAQREAALSALHALGARAWRVEAIVAPTEHVVRAGGGVERTSGPLLGGELAVAPASWLMLRGRALGGTLVATRRGVYDRATGELGADADLFPLPWLALQVGAVARSYTIPIGRQRWAALRTGAAARAALLDGAVLGEVRAALLPAVAVTRTAAPTLAVEGGAGMRYEGRRLVAGVDYQLERYDFPAQDGVRRLEQLARLTLSAGVRVGAAGGR